VGRLADQASVLVLHRLEDRALAEQLAWLTGTRLVPADLQWAYPSSGQAATGWPEPDVKSVAALGGGHAGAVRPGPAGSGPAGSGGPAGRAPPPGTAWSPVVTGDDLCSLGDDEFTLVPRADASRVVRLAVSVPARIPARRLVPAPRAADGDEPPGSVPPGWDDGHVRAAGRDDR
jgi:hypothetical protein